MMHFKNLKSREKKEVKYFQNVYNIKTKHFKYLDD